MTLEKSLIKLEKNSKIVKSSKYSEEEKIRASMVLAIEAENLMQGFKGAKRKECAKLVNSANSYISLLEGDIVQASDLITVGKKLRKRTKTLISYLSAVEEEKKVKATIEQVVKKTKEIADTAVSSIGDAIKKAIREELKDQKNKKIIDDLAPYSKKVNLDKKKIKNKLFVLERVPIIVITQDKSTYFKNAGFEVKELNKYIVLEDQLLIGINSKNQNTDLQHKQLVQKVVESLNLQSHEKYRVIGKPVHSLNESGLVWYWVVPEKTVNHYQKMNNVYFNPKGWGFAFK